MAPGNRGIFSFVAGFVAASAFAVFHGSAGAQALDVQRLAPQLVAFAGTPTNFQNLVNGLASGLPVTLVSATPDGFLQTATFTPVGTMSVTDIARTLEQARQGLIARGIAAPTAEQIGVSLVGGTLPTPVGATTVVGLLSAPAPVAVPSASTGSSAVMAPGMPTSSGLTISIRPTSASPQLRNTSDTPLPRNTSDTPLPRNSSDTPIPTNASATPLPASPNGPSPAVQLQNRR
jgi:hypothetical protein